MDPHSENLIIYAPPQVAQLNMLDNQLVQLVPPQILPDGSIQVPSNEPSSRADVVDLEQKLQQQLKRKQARLTGLCPIRFELIRQTLDELIRQVYVDSNERGLLLARLRTEEYGAVAAYQSLYLEALSQNAAQEQDDQIELNKQRERVQQLENENIELQRQLAEVQSQLTKTEQREIIRRSQEEKRYAEEQVFLQRQKALLQTIFDNRNAQ